MLMPLAVLNAEQMPDWFILKTTRGMDIVFFCYLEKSRLPTLDALYKFYSFGCS